MKNWLRNGGSVLETSPLLALTIVALLVLTLIRVVVDVPYLGAGETLVDFDAFYIVGLMIREGRLDEAYHHVTMFAAQRHFADDDSFMPWTYPPQFNLIVAALPISGRALSYALFTGLTLAAYLLVLRRISGPHLTAVLIALLPTLVLTTLIGQNGFLTGALVGWFCLATLAGRRLAGLPLGLMVIKPHLGVPLAALCLARGHGAVLAIAAAVVVASGALATLAFGPSVWTAFLGGVREAGAFLEAGFYPLFRMTSLYAALHTLGVAPAHAMAAQAGLAAIVLVVVVVAARRGPLRRALALAAFGAVAVSPYAYDYDMTLFGIGLALIIGEVVARCSAVQKAVLLGLCWLVGGWGLANVQLTDTTDRVLHAERMDALLSIGGPVYLLLLGLGAVFLTRPASPVPARSVA